MDEKTRIKLDKMGRPQIVDSLKNDPTGGESWRLARWEWLKEDDDKREGAASDSRLDARSAKRAAWVAAIAAMIAAVAAAIWPIFK